MSNQNAMTVPQMMAAFFIGAVIVIVGPLIYKYYSWLEYGFVAVIGLGVASVLVGASYGLGRVGLDLAMRWQAFKLAQAQVYGAQAEALAKLHTVTVIKPGHEAVITQIRHPALSAPVESFHYLAPPLAAKVATIAAIADSKPILDEIKTGEQWIKDMLFYPDGKLKAFHVKTDGPTGVGKTYLMLYMMWLMQQPYPKAEYYLIDPKFEGESSGWPFEPFVTDFEQAGQGMEWIYKNVVVARREAKILGQPILHPAFAIVDEVDGCFEDQGDKFTKPVKRIVKEGRSGMTHCFMAGQSALAKDTGFSGALFRNTARFVMGNEALAFTRNAQFSYWEKPHRDKVAHQLLHLQESGARYALAIPPSGHGLPFVGEIPSLELPDFAHRNLRPKDLADFAKNYTMTVTKSDKAAKVELALSQLKAEGKKVDRSAIARAAWGNAGGNQLADVDAALLELGISL